MALLALLSPAGAWGENGFTESTNSADASLTTATYLLPTTGTIAASDLKNGVWVRPELDETSITVMLQNLREWNISTLYLDVFRSGETLFPSQVFPQRPGATDRDWLAYIVDQAHDHGIGVHAWAQTLCWGDPDTHLSSSPVSMLQKNPDWIDLTSDGRQFDGVSFARYVSPAVPEVSDALTSLAAELCNYEINGINFDTVAYNYQVDTGYNPAAVAEFQELEGVDPSNIEPDMAKDSDWMRWTIYREDKLTSLVQRLADQCQKASIAQGRRIALSVIVQPGYDQNRGANTRYQHWAQWVREGIVDATTPACFESDLPGLERQLWEARSIHMGYPVACVPGFMLEFESDRRPQRALVFKNPYGHRESHPSLVDQKRLLRNAGFQYCSIMDYAALVQEKQQEAREPGKDSNGFWDFFRRDYGE